MGAEVRQLRPDRNDVPATTYGANTEANVTALEALLSEVRRTYSHVMWLEDYISRLPEETLFEGGQQFHPTQIAKWDAHPETRPLPGSIAWLLAVEQAKNMGVSVSRKPMINLALQQLLRERAHLVAVSAQAIRVGIALDEIELAKQHGELLVNAMARFATDVGLDPADPNVVKAILDALDEVTVNTQ